MIKFNVFIYESEEEYYEGETWCEASETEFVGLTLFQAVTLLNLHLTSYKVILVNQSLGYSDPDRLYIDISHGTIKNFIIGDSFRQSLFSYEIEQL